VTRWLGEYASSARHRGYCYTDRTRCFLPQRCPQPLLVLTAPTHRGVARLMDAHALNCSSLLWISATSPCPSIREMVNSSVITTKADDMTPSFYSGLSDGYLHSFDREYVGNSQKKTLSWPAVSNCCCSKGLAPYWCNPLFLIFDTLVLRTQRQSTGMSQIKNSGLHQYDKR